jgi:hypothetical protein
MESNNLYEAIRQSKFKAHLVTGKMKQPPETRHSDDLRCIQIKGELIRAIANGGAQESEAAASLRLPLTLFINIGGWHRK